MKCASGALFVASCAETAILPRMSSSLTHESRSIALEMHHVLSDIDPVRWRGEAADRLRAKLRAVHARMAALTNRRWPEKGAPSNKRLNLDYEKEINKKRWVPPSKKVINKVAAFELPCE